MYTLLEACGLTVVDFGKCSLKLRQDETVLFVTWDGKGSAETAREVHKTVRDMLIDHEIQFAELAPIFTEFFDPCTEQRGNPRIMRRPEKATS